MVHVTVRIEGHDRKVGAMVKALAFEVAGPESVAGATKAVLESTGCLEFRFRNEGKAEDFRVSVARYLPGVLATVEH